MNENKLCPEQNSSNSQQIHKRCLLQCSKYFAQSKLHVSLGIKWQVFAGLYQVTNWNYFIK